MKKHILFVDDEPNFLEGLSRMLRSERLQWEVHFANSVGQALEKVGKIAYDTIISDVSMPGGDGFDLLGKLQKSEKTADIPVIILTGGNDLDLKRRALEQGATDLLSKPVHAEDLLARVRSVLRLKSYQDELKTQKNLLEQKVRERTAQLEKSRLDIILRLGKAAEYRDEETGNHILRVGCYCQALAEEMQMTPEFNEMIFLASPMHDIGKIGIPDSILLKRGRLSDAERKTMQSHCIIGYEILLEEPKNVKAFLNFCDRYLTLDEIDNSLLKMAAQIALSHHEKWDGSGYPKGLQAEDIPLAGRIVALADVYDALRSLRPYKPAYSWEQTVDIMINETGHFDPMVFNAFEKLIEKFDLINNQFSDDPHGPESKAKVGLDLPSNNVACV